MTVYLKIVDPGIIDNTGHYAEYAVSICKAAQKEGYKTAVYAHREIDKDLIPKLNAKPVFRYGFWHRFIKNRFFAFGIDTLISNYCFLIDLLNSFKISENRQHLIFVPTCNHRQILAWALWVIWGKCPRLSQLVVFLRYTYYDIGKKPHWDGNVIFVQLGIWLLKFSERVRHIKVRMATDSCNLANEYQKLTRIPFEVLPIPHTDDNHYSHDVSKQRKHGLITYAFLGDARKEKGFDIIVDSILLLLKMNFLEEISFLIQFNVSSDAHAVMYEKKRMLSAINHPNVNLIKGALKREQYNSLINEAGVILLPYSHRVYHSRTSGPFTEALAAGKPVIVTKETWMSDQLKSNGAGIAIKENNPAELAHAIIQLYNHFDTYSIKARMQSEKWRRLHNCRSFIKHLFLR
jgi:glycosyltransferase involved in cell wall biosynthesis